MIEDKKTEVTEMKVFISILNFSNNKLKKLLKNKYIYDIGMLPMKNIDKEIKKNEEIIKQFQIRNSAMKMIRDSEEEEINKNKIIYKLYKSGGF